MKKVHWGKVYNPNRYDINKNITAVKASNATIKELMLETKETNVSITKLRVAKKID